jgi:HAD superfamily phosphoserine phosphatase-like hydrolase
MVASRTGRAPEGFCALRGLGGALLRLASFDLDGTLVHPAVFNVVADALGFGDALAETTRLYFEGKLTAEETFPADYRHFVGRDVATMRAALAASDHWTPGTADAVARLHDAGVRVAVTTDQPEWLATVAREAFGVDDVACTPAEVRHGRVTGSYQYAGDKWANLERLLKARRIAPADVAHAGNGANDVPIFRRVGLGVAVFPMSDAVRDGARIVIEQPRDLGEVVDAILRAEG